MHEAHTASTLELVINEQQLQNLSQIDLSRPTDNNNNNNQNNNNSNYNGNNQQSQAADFFSFRGINEWPARVRDGFNAKLDEAKSKSETRIEYAFEVIKAFSGILLWALCLICTIIVPVLMFFIGLFNLDNCLDRPQLPYLVVGIGFVMTSSNLFNLALALDLPILTNHRLLSVDTKNTIASILNILFNCMVAFLYILTTYMIYTVGSYSSLRHSSSTTTTDEDTSKVDKHNMTIEEGISSDAEQPNVEKYEATMDCGALLYQFTFWFITLTLCLFALLSLVAISLFAYNRYRLAILRGSTPRTQPMNHAATNMNPAVNGTTGSPFNSTGNSRMI